MQLYTQPRSRNVTELETSERLEQLQARTNLWCLDHGACRTHMPCAEVRSSTAAHAGPIAEPRATQQPIGVHRAAGSIAAACNTQKHTANVVKSVWPFCTQHVYRPSVFSLLVPQTCSTCKLPGHLILHKPTLQAAAVPRHPVALTACSSCECCFSHAGRHRVSPAAQPTAKST